jgi:hypothetical protein
MAWLAGGALKTIDEILSRVRREMKAGRAWRAKEILAGNVSSGRIEPQLLEEYGRLLNHLGDRVEAGKYLFLSGTRSEAYADAIALFRKRHAGRRGADLAAQLPAAVRRLGWEALPAVVRDELVARGVESYALRARASERIEPAQRWRDRLVMAAVFAVFVIAMVAMVLGLQRMASELWKWIR